MYVAGEGGGHVVRDARMPSLCRGHFPVPRSALVLHLTPLSEQDQDTHSPVPTSIPDSHAQEDRF